MNSWFWQATMIRMLLIGIIAGVVVAPAALVRDGRLGKAGGRVPSDPEGRQGDEMRRDAAGLTEES